MLAGYSKYAVITVPAGSIAVDQTGFELPVKINADSILAATAQPSGADIVFTLPDDTLLPFEIVRFNEVSGDLLAFVRVPLLSASTDTLIHAYIGNATAISLQNPGAVWADNTVTAHCEPSQITGNPDTTVRDSSPAGVDGIVTLGGLAPARTQTPMGTGYFLDGSQGIGFGANRFNPYLYTVSLWFSDLAAGNDGGATLANIGGVDDTEDCLRAEWKFPDWSVKHDWGAKIAGVPGTTAGTHKVTVSFDDVTTDLILYANGTEVSRVSGANIPPGIVAGFANFGLRFGDTDWPACDIAGISISNYAVSPDREAAYFAAQSSPEAFAVVGVWQDAVISANAVVLSRSQDQGAMVGIGQKSTASTAISSESTTVSAKSTAKSTASTKAIQQSGIASTVAAVVSAGIVSTALVGDTANLSLDQSLSCAVSGLTVGSASLPVSPSVSSSMRAYQYDDSVSGWLLPVSISAFFNANENNTASLSIDTGVSIGVAQESQLSSLSGAAHAGSFIGIKQEDGLSTLTATARSTANQSSASGGDSVAALLSPFSSISANLSSGDNSGKISLFSGTVISAKQDGATATIGGNSAAAGAILLTESGDRALISSHSSAIANSALTGIDNATLSITPSVSYQFSVSSESQAGLILTSGAARVVVSQGSDAANLGGYAATLAAIYSTQEDQSSSATATPKVVATVVQIETAGNAALQLKPSLGTSLLAASEGQASTIASGLNVKLNTAQESGIGSLSANTINAIGLWPISEGNTSKIAANSATTAAANMATGDELVSFSYTLITQSSLAIQQESQTSKLLSSGAAILSVTQGAFGSSIASGSATTAIFAGKQGEQSSTISAISSVVTPITGTQANASFGQLTATNSATIPMQQEEQSAAYLATPSAALTAISKQEAQSLSAALTGYARPIIAPTEQPNTTAFTVTQSVISLFSISGNGDKTRLKVSAGNINIVGGQQDQAASVAAISAVTYSLNGIDKGVATANMASGSIASVSGFNADQSSPAKLIPLATITGSAQSENNRATVSINLLSGATLTGEAKDNAWITGQSIVVSSVTGKSGDNIAALSAPSVAGIAINQGSDLSDLEGYSSAIASIVARQGDNLATATVSASNKALVVASKDGDTATLKTAIKAITEILASQANTANIGTILTLSLDVSAQSQDQAMEPVKPVEATISISGGEESASIIAFTSTVCGIHANQQGLTSTATTYCLGGKNDGKKALIRSASKRSFIRLATTRSFGITPTRREFKAKARNMITSKHQGSGEFFKIEWKDWLKKRAVSGSSISQSTWEAETGIDMGVESFSSDTTSIFLAGGTSGKTYTLKNTIITSNGETEYDFLRVKITA